MAAFENIIFAEVVGTIFYSFFGLFLMLACWWLIELLTPFSLRKELEEDQNMAIAIVMGAMFLALAIIIAAVIRT
ncbi:hypothetical protein JANAI62_01900 [Jannaschia pagri]|uniref:DUF350 domain-containing protein n=1 Tax=Jannaschia pagri TaxID=2829797 RepID=A0ABQ4NHK7_9RHOB|nr:MULTISPECIES: DUF350 domain-containing protein [unclassified Jannaschia]GIT90327.1 hypothetical protein JANAI61_07850 [Jannaschia sp. AI_61]GIT93567.1 hypothetical protein JANAI62_01900 [Jannaschia sp. AI_62]